MQVHRISQGVSRAAHKIKLIRECRTWLISDIVTGKVDVRSIEVPKTLGKELLALDEYTPDEGAIIDDGADMEVEG